MMRKVYIYALTEPDDPAKVRYIGKTGKELSTRLSEHLLPKNLRPNTHKNNWIKSLLLVGKRPNIVLIDIGDEDSWEMLERFHIASHRSAGFPLTNTTDGGDGALGNKPSEETRRKRSTSMIGKNVGKKRSEEYKRSKAEEMRGNTYARGKRRTPEQVERMRKGMLGVNKGDNCSTETRRLLSVASNKSRRNTGKKHSEDTIRAMQEARRAWWERKKAAT